MGDIVVLVTHDAGTFQFLFSTNSRNETEIDVHIKRIIKSRLGHLDAKIETIKLKDLPNYGFF